MKNVSILFCFILLLFTLPAAGSMLDLATVRGTLKTTEGKPVPFANLGLQRLPDSVMVKFAVTNEQGLYEFGGIASGRYQVVGTAVGYRKATSGAFDLAAGQTYEVPQLLTAPVALNMKEVTIEQQRPMVTVLPDKMVVNVQDNPLMVNTNALDVLRKSPGVVVNQDEDIFLLGKQGLVVYIDGRQTPMQAKDLANYLKSIPSSQIESIEIITNPSAKYDAAGNAGIINIRLRKNKQNGLNGTATLGGSYGLENPVNLPKANAGLVLNYGLKRVNLFANYSIDYSKSWSANRFYRELNKATYDQNLIGRQTGTGQVFKAGADAKMGRRHTVGIMLDGNVRNSDGTNTSDTRIFGGTPPEAITYKERLDSRVLSNNGTSSYNGNFNHNYRDSTGLEITTDANYSVFRLNNQTSQPNFYRQGANDSITLDRSFALNTPVRVNIAILKTDVEKTLGSNTFAFGYKLSDVRTRNTYDYTDRAYGQEALIAERSSNFNYTERVVAGYLQFKRKFSEKLNFQAGLRTEHTYSQGVLNYRQDRPDSTVSRDYLNWFPSAGITYQLNKVNAFTLSYSRRIDRPVYQYLNPFQNKIDELSYEQGNPYLKPQYTNNIQLTHTLFYMVNTTVGYSHTTQYFARVVDSAADGRGTFITRRNLADVKTFTVNVSSPLQIRKWWTGFANLTYNHQVYEANLGPNRNLSLAVDYYSLFANQNIALPGGKWSVQVSGLYASPNVWGGTFRNIHFWFVDAGLQRKVLNGQGTVSLTVSDVFRSMRWKGVSDIGGLYLTAEGTWDSRQVRLGFTYNFGKATKPLRKASGPTEEQRRLNGGDR